MAIKHEVSLTFEQQALIEAGVTIALIAVLTMMLIYTGKAIIEGLTKT